MPFMGWHNTDVPALFLIFMDGISMKKKLCLFFVAIIVSITICGCESNSKDNSAVNVVPQNSKTETTASDETGTDELAIDILVQLSKEEHVDLDDACALFEKKDSLSTEESIFYSKLCLLRNCSGRFVQQSEDSGNRYTADVAFYLSNGDIYCSVAYTGYMGEIADGKVRDSTQGDYYFEAFPKGNLYGREQDFKISFGNEKLYISWADTCEYTLTRGDGSTENAQERQETFEETGVLDVIKDLIDQEFPNNEHNVVYEKEESAISISIQFDGLRNVLVSNDSEKIAVWNNMVDSLCEWSKQLYDAAKIPTYIKDGIYWPYVLDVHIFVVDKIKTSGNYFENEMLLWVDNGLVKYNVISDNTQTNNHTATSGERNALQSAQNYLSVMAFSYSGLVEQLEYEGYSTSEAEYAADNCGADWNQQAVKKAKEYLDIVSFSRNGLIEQLEYEGFTHSQATYGVDQVY